MRRNKPIRDLVPFKVVVRRGARAWKRYTQSYIRKIMNRGKHWGEEKWMDF